MLKQSNQNKNKGCRVSWTNGQSGGHVWVGVASNGSPDIFIVPKGGKPIHIINKIKTLKDFRKLCKAFGIDINRDLGKSKLKEFKKYFNRKQQKTRSKK